MAGNTSDQDSQLIRTRSLLLTTRSIHLPRLNSSFPETRRVIMAAPPDLAHNGAEERGDGDRVKLLGIIDQLRELGVHEDIPLPQVKSCHGSSRVAQLTSVSVDYRWQPRRWKVIGSSSLDRPQLPDWKRCVYSLRHSDCSSPLSGKRELRQSVDSRRQHSPHR